jgi:hypothetical protein
MGFKLSIEQGKGQGQAFGFESEQITIGRAEENDVVLYDEQGVSRRHARIQRQDNVYYVEDLGSANGTLLNGSKVQREALGEGDTIGIGAVVFRFGEGGRAPAGLPKPETPTRIVPMAQPKSAAPPAVSPAEGGTNAGRAGVLAPVFSPRVIAILVVLILSVAALYGAYQGTEKGGTQEKCPGAPIRIDVVGGLVFGTTSDSYCRPGKALKFGFVGQPHTRYLFYYTPFYTEKGSLQVSLNDKPYDESPLAPTRRSARHEVVLKETDIKVGTSDADVNVLSFRPTGSNEWGIEHIELMPIPLDQSNAQEGEQHFQNGERLYEQRNVAARNLYDSYVEMRRARQLMEGLPEPKPPDYQVLPSQTTKIENELDALCHKELFTARRETTFGHFEAANNAYRFLLAAFPGDDHPCRQTVLAIMPGQKGGK